MPWDDLIRTANKAKARAKNQENTHLDQQCLKKKQLLKRTLNFGNDQAKKIKAAFSQTKTSLP